MLVGILKKDSSTHETSQQLSLATTYLYTYIIFDTYYFIIMFDKISISEFQKYKIFVL